MFIGTQPKLINGQVFWSQTMVIGVIIVAKVAIATQGIRRWVVLRPLPASISSFNVDVVIILFDVVVISFNVVVIISYCVVEGRSRPAEEKRQ